MFKTVVAGAGLPLLNITPHSIRRGGATYALKCKVPPVCIKLQGDWVSDAWQIYAHMQGSLKRITIRAFENRMR